MASSTAKTAESDFTVDIEAGHVVAQRVDDEDHYKIIAAKFFSRSRIDLSDAICSGDKIFNDPDDPAIQYKIVFYSTLASCKIKFRTLSNGAMILSRPKEVNQRGNRELKGLNSSRNDRANRSLQLTCDSSEITSGFNSLRRAIELSSNKLEVMLSEILKRIDNLEERSCDGHAKIQDTNLSITDMAMQAMQNCRTNPKWRQRIKTMSVEDLTSEQIKSVKKIMLSGNKFPSKMAISLAKVIYGDLLKTHLLGENGKSKRVARDGERSLVIPESMEDILRDLLKNFDTDLFTEQPGWDLLVRGPINQSGREVTRVRNKKRRNESETDDNEEAKRMKAGPSQPEKLIHDDEINSDQSTQHGHSDQNDVEDCDPLPGDAEIFGFNSIQGAAVQDENQLESRLALIDQRQTNMEFMIRSFSGRLDEIEKVLGIGSKQNQIYTSDKFPEEWSLRTDQDYVNFAKTKISHLRNNFEWRACFSAYKMDGLNDEKKAKIDFILTKGPINISKIVNTIAVEILGVECIKNYLVGVNGCSVKKHGHDKRPILPMEEESKLRTFFSLIDKIFISPNGWEVLVRKPINQMGREYFSGKRKSNEPIKQAMFMHSFLNKQPSIATQHKKAIERNKDETCSNSDTIGDLSMAMVNQSRSVGEDNQSAQSIPSPKSSPLSSTSRPSNTLNRLSGVLDGDFMERIYNRNYT
uniref:BEN domain-containing protein n=1 Tax=Tetranychus urticae TaxID=32264 RepID=T1K7E1_TETUR